MNEDKFNTSLRGFLKKVGITSQLFIALELAGLDGVAHGFFDFALRGNAHFLEKLAQAGIEDVFVHEVLLVRA